MSDDFDAPAFLALLEDAGLAPRGQTRKSFVFDCPQCSKKKKLYVYKHTGRFVCWHCAGQGFEGNPEFLLSSLLGVSVEEARRRVFGADAGNLSRHLDLSWVATEDPEEREIAPTLSWPFHVLPLDHPHAARGVAYLAGRGVPLEIAREYGMRYSPVERRVFVPVEEGGRLVGWQGRLIIPNKGTAEDGSAYDATKILSSRDIPRDRILMFGDRIRGDTAILCEGPFDAAKCHLIPGACATMGKKVSPGQIRTLREKGVQKLYLALDPDAAAETMALMAAFWDIEVYLVVIPPSWEDLGAMPFEVARDVIRAARRLRGYELILHWG